MTLLACRSGLVHVVRFCLDEPLDGAIDLLDDDERRRASRFIFDADRRRFVQSHAWTRIALAQCLDCAPQSLRFAIDSRGKPRLDRVRTDIRFNLSHSGERALLALALAQEVGVDLEQHRPIALVDLARRFFGAGEVAALEALPEADREPAFFRCWTRKEAFIKAVGDGFSFPLDGFEVSVADEGSSPQLLRASPFRPSALRDWRIVSLDGGPGYAAAVAASNTPWAVVRWEATSGLLRQSA
jgi:4'-phosphopantetheinyl transferase